MNKVRRFNEKGIESFREYIHELRKQSKVLERKAFPETLLYDSSTSEDTDFEMPDLPSTFKTKIELARYLDNVFPKNCYDQIRIDTGTWTWLAACMFDQITNGRKKIKEDRAYIAGLSFQEFYRHLIFGPYFIFFNAKDDISRVTVLLYDDPTTMNEVMVQFGSYQKLMQNKSLQEVVQSLYYDEDKGRIKRGAGGKEAGTPRRLMDFLRQLELNYDLSSVSKEKFWGMLPSEFLKFM